MADVTLSYKGSDILELSDSGSATLKTGGTYCEADIEVEYVKPSGGGGFIPPNVKTVTPTLVKMSEVEGNYLRIDYSGHDLFWDGRLFSRTGYAPNAGTTVEIIADHIETSNAVISALPYPSIDTVIIRSDNKYFTNIGSSFMAATGNTYGFIHLVSPPFLVTNNANNNYGFFSRNPSLVDARIVPNRIATASQFYCGWSSSLSDETIISIANGLTGGTQTVSFNATVKNKLSTIMGTVEHKTYNDIMDTEEEFDFFTADENGTVTLMDFITNTKGWTVA